MSKFIQRLTYEWNYIKSLFITKPLKGKIMQDSDFQAGVTAAITTYYQSLNGVYPVTGFTYTYTPPATATPPPVTVTVSI